MSEFLIPESERGFQCEMILDSVNPAGVRLTTMRWKYPLIVHAEACRHRAFSRSVASNRAIPTAKIIAMVEQDLFIPIYWGKAQPGMQADEELSEDDRYETIANWRFARDDAVARAKYLTSIGVHKQITNRLLMPFQWVTEIVTATDWANFFALRCHPAAQPEMRRIAEMVRDAYYESIPWRLQAGEWHIPLVTIEDRAFLPIQDQLKVSAARCARTSYRTHDGKVSTLEEDILLYDRLVGSVPPHVSPLEHQAMALETDNRHRNFRGWVQFRTFLPNDTEYDPPWLAGKESRENAA